MRRERRSCGRGGWRSGRGGRRVELKRVRGHYGTSNAPVPLCGTIGPGARFPRGAARASLDGSTSRRPLRRILLPCPAPPRRSPRPTSSPRTTRASTSPATAPTTPSPASRPTCVGLPHPGAGARTTRSASARRRGPIRPWCAATSSIRAGSRRPKSDCATTRSSFPSLRSTRATTRFPERVQRPLWAERTPAHFTFHLKAHALMTGQPTEVARLPERWSTRCRVRSPRSRASMRRTCRPT